ncbi:MAG TPA: hypothetical protein VH575_17450 [Gemmataceae bacterium]
MPTRSNMVFFAVFVCLLLSLAGGGRPRRSERDNHIGRDRQRLAVRLRRLRTDYPVHHPVRPTSAAVIPPDDDDDDDEHRFRLAPEDTREFTLARHEESLAAHSFPRPSARPSAPNQPLYQTLGILLI